MISYEDWIDEYADEYENNKNEKFIEFFTKEAKGMTVDEMNEEWYCDLKESFTYDSFDEWANKDYESYVSGYQDIKYEEYKDRKMGL